MTYLGIKYPYQGDTFDLTTDTKEQIKSDIMVLLAHELGDRYMMPYFGVNFKQYLFEPLDDTTINQIITEVKSAIQKFIFGVLVTNVDVLLDGQTNCIGLNIQYTISDGFRSEQDFVEVIY